VGHQLSAELAYSGRKRSAGVTRIRTRQDPAGSVDWSRPSVESCNPVTKFVYPAVTPLVLLACLFVVAALSELQSCPFGLPASCSLSSSECSRRGVAGLPLSVSFQR
jgi:hypothetical protein